MRYIRRCLMVFLVLGLHSIAGANDMSSLLEPVANGVFVAYGKHEQISKANHGLIGNTGIVIGETSVAVIDPGGNLHSGLLLRRALRELTNLPVKFVILTHFHPDHVVGAAAFTDTATIMAHENYPRAMLQRAQFYLDRFAEVFTGPSADVFITPDRLVHIGSEQRIDLGQRILTIAAHPVAHTDNDLTVHDSITNTLFAGDLIFAQRTPAIDGSLSGWQSVTAKLRTQSFGITVPGHGSVAKFETLEAEQTRYLEQLADYVRQMIDEGVALSDVLQMHEDATSAARESEWLLYSTQHATNLSKAYTELEWE